MAFSVTSTNFKDGDYLGKDFILSADYGFGCAGGNKSPHIAWSGAPTGTKSFAVHCHDPDAPTGSANCRSIASSSQMPSISSQPVIMPLSSKPRTASVRLRS